MITSQCIQRMTLSAALLVLPLIIYCSEIVGNPHPAVQSAERVQTLTSPVTSAAHQTLTNDKAVARQIFADMVKGSRPGS